MNKSIMKTRNQLQRITFKINQLKNKYSCQSMDELPADLYNRPVSQHSAKRQVESPAQKTPEKFEDLYRKEFRMFRNELYEHIDHQLARIKGRENQLEQQIQELIHQLHSKSQPIDYHLKFVQLQQEVKDLIVITQDITYQSKKTEAQHDKKIKSTHQRIDSLQIHQDNLIQDTIESFINRHSLKMKKEDLTVETERKKELRDLSAKIQEIKAQRSELELNENKTQRQIKEIKSKLTEIKLCYQNFDDVLKQIHAVKAYTLKEIKDFQASIKKKEDNLIASSEKFLEVTDRRIEDSQNCIMKSINNLLKTEIQLAAEKTQEKYLSVGDEKESIKKSLWEDLNLKFNRYDTSIGNLTREVLQMKQSTAKELTSKDFGQELNKYEREMNDFTKEVYLQIEGINKVFLRLNDKTQSYQQKLKTSNEQTTITIKSYANTLSQVEQKNKLIEENLMTLTKIVEDLRQVETTELRRSLQQLTIKLEISVSSTSQQIGELHTQISSLGLAQGQQKTLIQELQTRTDQVFNAHTTQTIVQKASLIANEDVRNIVQEHFQLCKRWLFEAIQQESNTNNEKINKLDQNILQSAQQFKEYVAESEQCYSAIQQTIKTLSQNIKNITENHCRLQQSHSKLNAQVERQTQQLTKLEHIPKQQRGQSRENQKISLLQSKLIDITESFNGIRSLLDSGVKSRIEEDRGATYTQLNIEERLDNIENALQKTVDHINDFQEEMQRTLRSEIAEQVEKLVTKFEEKVSLGFKRVDQRMKKITTANNFQCSTDQTVDIQFSRLADNLPQQLLEKCTSLQDQIGFIKRTFINGQESKTELLEKKVRKQIQDFKKRQQQAEYNLKSVISHEVHNSMAGHFNKITQILEKTFQELQHKHEKIQETMNQLNKRIEQLTRNSHQHDEQKRVVVSSSVLKAINDNRPNECKTMAI